MKKVLTVLLAAALIVCSMAGAAFGSESYEWPQTPEKVYTISVANAITPQTPAGEALQTIADEIEARSNGAVVLDIFWESVIGTAQEQAESVMTGSIDMAILNSGVVSQYADTINIMTLPFMFNDREHVKAVLNEYFDEITAGIEESGLGIPLGVWDLGFKQVVTTDKQVTKVEDLQGMTIRVMDGKIYSDIWNAFGAIPQNIAASELVTALQQGVVDGVEEAFQMCYNQQQYTFCKYAAEINYTFASTVAVLSEDAASSYPEEVIDLIKEVFAENLTLSNDLAAKYDQQYLDAFEEDGNMTVISITGDEKQKFVEAVQPIWEEYGADMSELIEKIQALGSEAE